MLKQSKTSSTIESPQRTPWHALPASEVITHLQTSGDGLSETEAETRLVHYGPNKLPEQPPPSVFEIALRQFKSPLIYVLAIAAAVAIGIGDFKDAFFILAVIVINALIGGYQEWKAEQSSLALHKLLQIHATVQRDHAARDIVAEHLVPGDEVLLESGNRVPADVRLLSAYGFEVDESLLTGESIPVVKTKSALLMSPFRSPILMAGAIGAFLVHFTAMHLPLGQAVLGTAPIDLRNWPWSSP